MPKPVSRYFGARYYRAHSGRFTSVDAVLNVEAALTDPQRWNRYAYAVSRPFAMIDPDGREAGYIYLKNGQMTAPITGLTPTMAKLWAGTIAMGGAALAAIGGIAATEAAVTALTLRPTAANILDSVARLFGDSAGQRTGPSSRIASFSPSALMKGFMKHGADFGLTGSWTTQRSADFSRAINMHINRADVNAISGTYRGIDVTHYLDPKTGLNVILDKGGQYISGWRLSKEQLESVLGSGRLF